MRWPWQTREDEVILLLDTAIDDVRRVREDVIRQTRETKAQAIETMRQREDD